MKYYIIILLITVFNVSKAQINSNAKMTDDLFKMIIDYDSSKMNEIYDFLSISDKKIDNDKLLRVIKLHVIVYNQSLKYCDMKYRVYQHHLIDESLLSRYRLQYKNYDNVYYVVCNDMIMTHVICENDKIISFFSGLTKGSKKPVIPIILDEFIIGDKDN